jgi:excinuclease ABC subunit C
MTRADLDKTELPDATGVYFFLGPKKEILYIGKATSLRSRVRSYFAPDLRDKRSALIANMVRNAASVECTETDSVLEALILETNLIRTHKPKYNTLSKDDKSYNHLIITKEEWPRVLVVRGKDLATQFNPRDIKYEFGPFPSGALFKEALKIIRKLFKFYDTKRAVGVETSNVVKGRIDFNRQIGLYPSEENRYEYTRTIRHIKLFFQGKKNIIIKELQRDMMRHAKAMQFEEANNIKKRILALQHIHDIALIKDDARVYRDDKSIRIEAYDIAHLQGSDMVGVMTVVDGNQPNSSEYRKFNIRGYTEANDPGALREVLTRRLGHPEWSFPQLIVVDGNAIQKRAAELVLKEHGSVIPVVAVVKNHKHKPERLIGQKDLLDRHQAAILEANAEAHRFAITFHRHRRSKSSLGITDSSARRTRTKTQRNKHT